MGRDHLTEYGSVSKTSAVVGQQLGISPNTLRRRRVPATRRAASRRTPTVDRLMRDLGRTGVRQGRKLRPPLKDKHGAHCISATAS